MSILFSILIVQFRIAFVLVIMASVSVMAMSGISASEPPFDPFAPYADILPGQSREAVLQRGFHCQFNIVPSFEEFCSLTPETGIFSEIQVKFAAAPYTHQVRHVVFTLREKVFTLGHLVSLWGIPQITLYGETATFRWRNRHIIAVPQAYHRHFSYWHPIVYVVFQSTE